MFIKELKCSNCGSNDFKSISYNTYSCTYCGTLNYIHKPEEKKETTFTTTTYTVPSAPNQSSKMIVVFAAVFSMVLAGTISYFLMQPNTSYTDLNSTSSSPKKIEINGVSYLDTITTKENHQDIHVAWYEMSDTSDFEWWKAILIVGEVENKSGAVWKYPSIEFTFFNKGLKVGNINTKLDQEYILPKSKESFSLDWSFPQMFDSVAVVNKAEPFFFHPPNKNHKFKILDESFTYRNGYEALLEGIFENPNTYSINISGVVKFYDAEKKYVGAQNIYSGLLKKGEKTKFNITARFILNPKTTSPSLMRKPESYTYFLKVDSIPG